NRFAILDSRRKMPWRDAWKQWSDLNGDNAAIYYPWIRVPRFDSRGTELVPPCGHVAGVYTRSDQRAGVHKTPANEALEGVVDLEVPITQEIQTYLNPKGINCLRSFPGRGIRVWGGRTVSNRPEWTYINVRRVFLTAVRWIEWHFWEMIAEPND